LPISDALHTSVSRLVPDGNSRPYFAAVSNDASAALILMPSSSTPATETVMSALITNPLSSIRSIRSTRVVPVSRVGSIMDIFIVSSASTNCEAQVILVTIYCTTYQIVYRITVVE